jgi:hypothetical protein
MTSVSIGLRVSEGLRDKLATQANLNHRSLNGEITARLEASFRSEARVAQELFDAIALPRVVRMTSSNTNADKTRILNAARHLPIERAVFAAKANDLNKAVLVLILETPRVTFLLDGSWINMARSSREAEVQEIFQGLDRLGVLDNAEYCSHLVDDTSQLPPEQALEQIAKTGHLAPLRNLADYLRVLAQHEYFDPADYRATASEGRHPPGRSDVSDLAKKAERLGGQAL